MVAKKKPAKKTYPAKRAASARKASLPGVLEVEVHRGSSGFTAAAVKKSASGHSPSWAVRNLAKLLGYAASADVRYVRTDADQVHHFQIVEVSP